MKTYQNLANVTGTEAVLNYRGGFEVTPTAGEQATDGLTFAPKDGSKLGGDIVIPPRLLQKLIDIRLLRGLPLAYLVPDAALLPPESIRFFHIDRTWVDRVVDGVFSCANIGTIDSMYGLSVLAACRKLLDNDPNLSPQPMCGMLIRSDLVRRWPDMIVRADVGVLRAETLSENIYIAVFAQQPKLVEVREPNVGVRFGVEPGPNNTWKVDGFNAAGQRINSPITIGTRNAALRVLDIGNAPLPDKQARTVALHLEQLPYVQEFRDARDEASGSVDPSAYKLPTGGWSFPLKKGRVFDLSSFVSQNTAPFPKGKP